MKNLILISILTISILSCNKDDTSTNNPPSNAQVYWYCDIDGKQYKLAIITGLEDIESNLHIESTIATPGQGSSLFTLGCGIYETSNVGVGFSLIKGTMTIPQGGYPNNDQFLAFMNDQNNAYSPNGLNGIDISFLNEQQEIWSSSLGSQSGSSFKFTQLTPTEVLGEDLIIAEAEFSCSLYNGNGQVKKLTNGKSKLTFGYQ